MTSLQSLSKYLAIFIVSGKNVEELLKDIKENEQHWWKKKKDSMLKWSLFFTLNSRQGFVSLFLKFQQKSQKSFHWNWSASVSVYQID